MKLLKPAIALLVLLSCSRLHAQQFDIGLKLLLVKQEGRILNTTYGGYGSPYDVARTYACFGGHFGVYYPLYMNLSKRFSAGAESGLYFAYNKKRFTRDLDYYNLQVSQSKLTRTIGALEVPLMGSIRTGKLAGVPDAGERSFGLSGGMHVLYFYVSNERGVLLTPAVSAIFGMKSNMFFRFDLLTRAYKSEYETTLGNIPRLSNKCWAISLNLAL